MISQGLLKAAAMRIRMAYGLRQWYEHAVKGYISHKVFEYNPACFLPSVEFILLGENINRNVLLGTRKLKIK